MPIALAITPDGKAAYVADGGSGNVTPVNLATSTAGPAIATGAANQWGIAIAPSGVSAYLGNFGSNTLIPINLATNSAGAAMTVGAGPAGVAISPDGASAFVSNSGGNSLSPVNLATGAVGPAIGVGATPYPVAITPDQAPLASFSVSTVPAGSASSFDASASSVAFGSITSYAWNFGDGHGATTATPTVTHVYSAPGTYTATLTETDAAGTSTATTQVFTGQTVSRHGGASAQTSRAFVIPAAPRVQLPAPAIVIRTRSLTLTRGGDVFIQVICPVTAGGGCHGTVTIQLAHPRARRASAFAARCARGCRSLGHANYEARAGQQIRVRVHMASFARKLIARRKTVRTTLIVTSVSGASTRSASVSITVHAHRRGA
jgi:YVTN family beta-propeller protein